MAHTQLCILFAVMSTEQLERARRDLLEAHAHTSSEVRRGEILEQLAAVLVELELRGLPPAPSGSAKPDH